MIGSRLRYYKKRKIWRKKRKYEYLVVGTTRQFLNYVKCIIFGLFFSLYRKKFDIVNFKLCFYNFFIFCFFLLNFKILNKLENLSIVNFKINENFSTFFSFLVFSTFLFPSRRLCVVRKFFRKRNYFFNILRIRRLIRRNRKFVFKKGSFLKLVKWRRINCLFKFRFFNYSWRFSQCIFRNVFFLVPVFAFFINFFNFSYFKDLYLLKYEKLFFNSLEKKSNCGGYENLNLNLNKFFLTTYLKGGKYLKNFVNLQNLNDKLLLFLRNRIKVIESVNFFFFLFHLRCKLVRRLVGKRFSEIMKSVGNQKEQSKLLLQFLFFEYYNGARFFESLAFFFLDYRFENFIGTYKRKYLKKFNKGNCKFIFRSQQRKRFNRYTTKKRFGW